MTAHSPSGSTSPSQVQTQTKFLPETGGFSGLTVPATTGITVNNAGSGNSHENKPPYLGVHFIISV